MTRSKYLGYGGFFPALAGFPTTSRWRNNVCVSLTLRIITRITLKYHSARDQNARNPGIPDGFGQFSMVWGKFLIDLKPGASRISRVMVPKYFLVVSKFVVATRKCCRMQVGNNNSYCRGILVLRRCKTTQTVAKNVWTSF